MNASKYTPGAIRAARRLHMLAADELTVAGIIDEETAAPEMLGALELAEDALAGFYGCEESETLDTIRAAIRKAKGE